jgi:hypothetical protein
MSDPLSARDDPLRVADIRVLTLNLWGRRGHWAARRRVLVEGLRKLRPDLVAFQEAIKTDEYDQVADLLGPGYHVAHQEDREPGQDDVEPGQGASIASRWPLGDVTEVDLNVTPRTSDFACSALVAEILAPKPVGPMLFVNHLPNWQLNFELERELQAVAVARAACGSCPVASPWKEPASATGTRGRASIPAIRATPSRPAIR